MRRLLFLLLTMTALPGCSEAPEPAADEAMSTSSNPATSVLAPAQPVRLATFSCDINEPLQYNVADTTVGTPEQTNAVGCAMRDGSSLGFEPATALFEARSMKGPSFEFAWHWELSFGDSVLSVTEEDGAARIEMPGDADLPDGFATFPIQARLRPQPAGVAQDVRAQATLTFFEGPIPIRFTALS